MSDLFGLEINEESAKLIIIPVPWEGTVSYGKGTAKGPEAVLTASSQIDLCDSELGDISKPGIFLADIPKNFNNSKEVNDYVSNETAKLLADNKLVGILGGEHSVPLGAYQAISQKYSTFGILQIDAHMDLRLAYEGNEFSHASIMRNALERIPEISKLVQVGIRDFCEEERDYALAQEAKVATHFDAELFSKQANGTTWDQITKTIVSNLPEKVWVSFDIDGLDPALCPNTGTPVPGGLSFNQVNYLVGEVVRSGREIIGFDLCEVALGNDEFDGNIGMRVLYKLCGWTFKSKKLLN